MMAKYGIDDWRAVRARLSEGKPIRRVAAETGVDRNTVFRWGRLDAPPERMVPEVARGIDVTVPLPGRSGPRSRLDLDMRARMAALAAEGKTDSEIARAIGVHRSTVGRELARNSSKGVYDPGKAQLMAEKRARRPKERRLDGNHELRTYVVNALTLRWSPEQISRRIRADFPDNGSMRISHETIYQALYVQGKGELRHELGVELALRSGRRRRKPRSRLPRRADKPWVEGARISDRPAEAADRAIPGHWEGDLVIGGDMSSCLITLVERRSRTLLMSRLLVHDAQTVEERMVQMAAGLPAELSKSITWDQGSEMACVADFELATDFKVYFCDPHSPWQRPTNENTNGLIREFFPKGTSFSEVTDEEVAHAQWLLNNRPRKVLGWKTPIEKMGEVIADVAMIA